ncbi:Hypothetical predicted protein [Olea europaea subsp. europaea]|uniref:Uncharacterized protein n=1 Tax=Olea europaea subsp. europaea TaxID=158383 RepID=A0A8S0RZ75_OLEEU|nr:Hypothetical predicted protein [Olea europaea subsp. europaea]
MEYCEEFLERCRYLGYNPKKFSSPMPWIGIYVAFASAICSLAMALDAINGFFKKKFWFPCRVFTLNAASLTLLAIAVKLPMDLNNPMPRYPDQLAKFSSTVLMSTAMANFMPSLGSMDDKEIFMNMIALGIFVITLLVNVCIQIYTGVIYADWFLQALVMFFIIVMFVIMSFSSLVVPTTKKYLEFEFRKIDSMIASEDPRENGMTAIEKLKEDLKKYWIMAETGNPQFVMARSVTCTACCAICILNVLMLSLVWIQNIIIYFYIGHHRYFHPASDYGKSTYVIAWIQSIGVIIGTIGPLFRLVRAVKFKRSILKIDNIGFKLEKYWIERLLDWKERPLALRIRNRRCQKVVHKTKDLMLSSCIKIQIAVVAVSKSLLLMSTFLSWPFFSCYFCFLRCRDYLKSNGSKNKQGSGLESKDPDISHYVLHLEGEEQLPRAMGDNYLSVVSKGRRQPSQQLRDLLHELTNFNSLAEFDSSQIPSVLSLEPPNCWKLPVVTLSSILIAIPNIDDDKVESVLNCVRKGMAYVSLVDKVLAKKLDLKKVREAADATWLDVDLLRRWQGEDLRNMATEGKTSKEILEKLCVIANKYVIEFKMKGNIVPENLELSIKVIAANSMYRISRTLLLLYNGISEPSEEEIFKHISILIANILGACLTNIPQVITMNFRSIAPEKREKSVCHAARILGETEEILEALQKHDLPVLTPEQLLNIDEWRVSMEEKILSSPITASSGTRPSSFNELQTVVDQ